MNARKSDGRVFMLVALLGIAGSTFLTGCGGDEGKDDNKPQQTKPATEPK